ncbi:peroxiredoxin family protein [Lysobacter capsici]
MSHIRDSGTVARHYGVTAVPNLFVIDQRGAIAQVHRGYSPQQLRQFAEEIAALLPPEALKRPAATDKQAQ